MQHATKSSGFDFACPDSQRVGLAGAGAGGQGHLAHSIVLRTEGGLLDLEQGSCEF